MKRTTQISILVEHRTVALSFIGAVDPGPHPIARAAPGHAAQEPANITPVCPDCGAAWIVVTALEAEIEAPGMDALYRALQQHGLHLGISSAGQLSICSKSLQGMVGLKESR
jgi:hypothetical protein